MAPVNKQALPEAGVRAHSAEATRLYQRGVAAARGGQRRIAAGLLSRSLQLDPQNERAWLWLSGVLDDPHQVAFCLQSVLKLNPENERASKGLRWLEERKLLQGAPARPAPLLDVNVEEPVEQRSVREQGESWWVNWRRTRQDMRRTRLLLWSVPLVLLCLALVLHQAFALAVEQVQNPPPVPARISAAVVKETGEEGVVMPILEEELSAERQVTLIRYVSTVEPLRQQLRNAVDSYRNATNQPGGASVGHVTAAQRLRNQVARAHVTLQDLTPPDELQGAHDDYLRGLELELEAIDAILEFYGSYEVEQANRAALRFQQASSYLDRARTRLDSYEYQLGLVSTVSVFTPR